MPDIDNEYIFRLLSQKYKSYYGKIIGLNVVFRLIISAILFVLTSFPYLKSGYIPFELLSLILWLLILMIITWTIQRYSLQQEINRLEYNIFRNYENKSYLSDWFIEKTYIPVRERKVKNILSISVVLEPITWIVIAIFIFQLNINYLKDNNFRNKELIGFDLGEKSLVDINFTNSDLSRSNFLNANLKRANFRGAKLVEADLRQSNLEEANFVAADLQNSSLVGANLNGANLYLADLREAKVTENQLNRARLCKTSVSETIKINPDRDCDK